jgi:hypothetical protein
MKNIIKNTAVAIIIAAAIGSATSCKKDSTKPETTPTTSQYGLLAFHIHTNIDTAEADSGAVCTDANGRHFQLNLAQFYISGIKLKKIDGTFITVDNVYLLKTIAQEEYIVGNVPVGNYKSVSFNIGIDAAANATNPSSYSSSSVLSAQSPSMWFGNTSYGYIFMNVQGVADSSAGNNGSVNQPFSYQLGTSSMLRTVNLPDQPFSINVNQGANPSPQFVHMIADYGKLLKGVSFKTQNTGTPWANPSVAAIIADSIPIMFHYE